MQARAKSTDEEDVDSSRRRLKTSCRLQGPQTALSDFGGRIKLFCPYSPRVENSDPTCGPHYSGAACDWPICVHGVVDPVRRICLCRNNFAPPFCEFCLPGELPVPPSCTQCDREILPSLKEPLLHGIVYLLIILLIVLTYFVCTWRRPSPPPYTEVTRDPPPPPYYLI
ncbi:unnamed protein product [Heligmosomoides polygyrus]|uniref:Uncharacterized protein n=1 Tax=Heligmosomoides polygyrus TaxID=6339 RepID=A0A3P8E400_HELPZ|nr:unnamed protein product [Heligmosomoides polygyrus]